MKYADYFKEIPVLRTERLQLRAFMPGDMEAYLNITQDPAVLQYTGGGVLDLRGEGAVNRWLANINGRVLKSKLAFTWCIADASGGQVIGRIDLGGFDKRAMAEIAYHLDSRHWGRGFATEAAQAVTDFGLDSLLLHRIQGLVMPENTASLRVLEKCGYVREGLLRKYHFGQGFHDAVMLAIIREENMGIAK